MPNASRRRRAKNNRSRHANGNREPPQNQRERTPETVPDEVDDGELPRIFADFLARMLEATVDHHSTPPMSNTVPGQRAVEFDPDFLAMVDEANAARERERLTSGKTSSLVYAPLPIDPATAPSEPARNDSGGTIHIGRLVSTQPQTGHPSELIDGQVECVLASMEDKALLLAAPGYPQPIPRPPVGGAYDIREVEGKGLGMVATRDIAFGEMIASERALLISTAGVWRHKPSPSFSKDDIAAYQEHVREGMDAEEQIIQQAFIRMPEIMQQQYMALHDCHSDEETSGPLFGRLRTNGYVINFAHGSPEHKVPYTAVFNDLSRINHSCSPNTTTSWDPASLSRQCYALRPIAKGEEITTTYMVLSTLYSEREVKLKGYNITCKCEACASPNSFLTKLNAVQSNVPAILKWCSNPSLPDDLLLKPTLHLLELAESEGQEGHPAYRRLIHHLACIYVALGDNDEGKKWMKKGLVLDEMHGMIRSLVQAAIDMDDVRRATIRSGDSTR